MNNDILLIDPEQRQKTQLRCHFCGTGLSVKYMVSVFDPVVSFKPTTVACCNKCALIFNGKDNCKDG